MKRVEIIVKFVRRIFEVKLWICLYMTFEGSFGVYGSSGKYTSMRAFVYKGFR